MLRTIIAGQPPNLPPCTFNMGIAFDGTDLLVACRDSHRIDYVSTTDGTYKQRTVNVASEEMVGAIAFDATRADKVWACTSKTDFNRVVLIDLASGWTSLPFMTQEAGCYDGLAFDASGVPQSLYHSADAACEVGHSDTAGVPLHHPASDVCPLLNGGNSGLAVGGPDLYLGNYGQKRIYRASKAFPIASPTLVAMPPTPPGDGTEDMECDDVTFPGQTALWAIEPYSRVVRAYEIPNGSCKWGGAPPMGILKVCKRAGEGIPAYGTGTPPATTQYFFSANGGTPFGIHAGLGPYGYCDVAGAFPAGQAVTVQEQVSVGSAASDIAVEPPERLVPDSTDVPGQQVKVTMGTDDNVTYAIFTDKAVPTGYIEVCKRIKGELKVPLPLFVHFLVPGYPDGIDVPPGDCSPPMLVNAGSALPITELPPYGTQVGSCAPSPLANGGPCHGNTATINVDASESASTQTIITFTDVRKALIPKWGKVKFKQLTAAVVRRVIDSKTLRVETGRRRQQGLRKFESVRLVGIEAPTFTRLTAASQCGGMDATNAMLHRVFGHRAVDTDADALEDDTGRGHGLAVLLDTARARPHRDRRGRVLAYVVDSRTGDDLGRLQIAAGWAKRVGIKRRSTRFKRYGTAQAHARRGKRGVWKQCRGNFQLHVPAPEPSHFPAGPESGGSEGGEP